MNLSHGHIYQYNGEELMKEKFDAETFVEAFSMQSLPKDKTTWVNFYIMDDFPVIENFCKNENYNILVFQNIKEKDNRPQFEDFGNYLFFTIRSAVPSSAGIHRFHQEQLSFILGENYLFSFQSKPSDYFASVRDRLENNKGITREKGVDFLLYRMLDAIIDNYFEVMDINTLTIEDLELKMTKTSNTKILSSIELQKRKLMEMRRIVLPMKEISIALESSKSSLFKPETHHYYTDLKNNCISILEEIESNKNALEGLTNLYYAVQGQRMNEIMKVLTIVSTIFIPLTFIVGIYGMNFENMPELKMKNGYYISWGVMILITIGLLFYFKKRGWMNRN